MDLAYFDSSVFLAIFNGESTAEDIKALMRELRRGNAKICTSIITVQEVSVLEFAAGGARIDNHTKVDQLARIHGVNREIALLAAQYEAELKRVFQSNSQAQRQENNRRRKWDCFHIATAVHLRCRWLYALDEKLLNRKDQLAIPSLIFSRPHPSSYDLFRDDAESPIRVN
ncbi:MAG: type II toxin-antitoxin system VapC family toxin [Bryobacteraceae bacterium]